MLKYPLRKDSLRLRGYDYRSANAYFITIVTWQRVHWFGDVADKDVRLNETGKTIADEWRRSEFLRPDVGPNVGIDEFVVMPNHLHAIVWLEGAMGDCEDGSIATVTSLPSLVNGFKSATVSRLRRLKHQSDLRLWQRGFHDRVLRNEREIDEAHQYILRNPANWSTDRENPLATQPSTSASPFTPRRGTP